MTNTLYLECEKQNVAIKPESDTKNIPNDSSLDVI